MSQRRRCRCPMTQRHKAVSTRKKSAEKGTTFTNVTDTTIRHIDFSMGFHLIRKFHRTKLNYSYAQCWFRIESSFGLFTIFPLELHLERPMCQWFRNKNGLNLFESQMKTASAHCQPRSTYKYMRSGFVFTIKSCWPYFVLKKNVYRISSFQTKPNRAERALVICGGLQRT